MRRFEVGDIICITTDKFSIIDIVFGEQDKYKGNWKSGDKEIRVENCYILLDTEGVNLYLAFDSEYLFEKVGEFKITSNKHCPRCDGEFIKKISEYDGSIIDKCNKCGFC